VALICALEWYLVGHVHMASNLFFHTAGHAHAASFAPRIAEGPADGPLAEGPADSPVLSSAL
jgi:hypothetical protein